MRTLGRNAEQSNSDLYYELYYRRAEDPDKARPEPIVLASVLADAVNASVTTRGHMMVDKINGVRIDRLDDVVRAFEMPTNNFDVIEFVSTTASSVWTTPKWRKQTQEFSRHTGCPATADYERILLPPSI